MAKKDQELTKLRARLADSDPGAESSNIKPENIVWIFGAGRRGSTWLSRMMGEMPGYAVWREPLVGELFGNLYYRRGSDAQRKSSHFILGTPRRRGSLSSGRSCGRERRRGSGMPPSSWSESPMAP